MNRTVRHELDKVRHEPDKVRHELDEIRHEPDEVQVSLGQVAIFWVRLGRPHGGPMNRTKLDMNRTKSRAR